jgi:tetratricopeptide (TPR) repeat protein/tRNA A-37 threonylcarbamoyl transferase component Bud32
MSDQFAQLQAALADRYILDRVVGAGGMATVYLAQDLRHHRKVAVKVLRPELAALLGPERFLREIQITANLNHPHILPLLDSGEADGTPYYVMPYVEGESLRERLTREKQLEIQDALRITIEVADALSFAHEHNVLHRDIKPENILLEAGHAVIADFGIARAITAAREMKLTEVGIALGTPGYLSPEQACGRQELDGRSDVYSLGCVLFEMLGGEPPQSASPRVLSGAVPKGIAQVMTKALATAPEDRFATAAHFAEAVASLGTGVTPGLRSGAIPARKSKPAVIALGALVVAAIASLVWPEPRAALVPERIVVAMFENRTGDPALRDVGTMATDWITQALLKAAMVEVIPSPTAIQASQFVSGEAEAGRARDPVRALAEETGAGTVVSGAYYGQGDSLHFQVQVTDARAGKLLGALDMTGTRESRAGAIEQLRERVLGVLAVSFDERLTSIPGLSGSPPTFQAYQEFSEGMRRYIRGDYANATPSFYRAFDLDSTFLVALLFAAINHNNLSEWAEADSVLEVVAQNRGQLTDYHRHWLEHLQAEVDGDVERSVRAIRQAAEAAPGSKAVYNFALMAGFSNRPRDAIQALESLDPDRGPMRGWMGYWRVLAGAHHTLGNHERELEVTRRAREAQPQSPWPLYLETQALAGLGRIEDANEALDGSASLPRHPTLTPGLLMTNTAVELGGHGYPEAARTLFDRAIRWYATVSPDDAASVEHRMGYGSTLYAAESWDEATGVFEALAEELPDHVETRAMLGVLAARRGDREQAASISKWLRSLDRPYLFGQHTFNRARIAAVLGEPDRAVALLREAFGKGYYYTHQIPMHIDFRSLSDYAPYQDLVRPKG